MSDKPSALSKPGGRFILSVALTLIAAAACCVLMYLLLPVDEAGKILASQRLRAPATISDILATVLSISGVTAPLVVAYLLVGERELQAFFVEKLTLSLEHHGSNLVSCRFAYLALCESSTPANPTPDLKTLHFLSNLNAEDEEETSKSEREAIGKVIPDARIRNKYYACFSDDQDKDWLKSCVVFIGLSALACFVDLYLRVLIDFGVAGDIIELFIIITALGANVTAYILILDFVTTKGAIKRQSSRLIRDCCSRAAPEIARAHRLAEVNRDQLGQELKDMIERLKGVSVTADR